MPRTTPPDTLAKAIETTPFLNAEDAWFWFIQANQARQDGARTRTAQTNIIRPCEPVDILQILERLQRKRRLDMNHFRVLRYYGVRMMAPDYRRPKEAVAAQLWREAMKVLSEVFIAKGIILPNLSAEIIWFQSRKHGVRGSW